MPATATEPSARSYVPGLGAAFLTRFYDPVQRLLGLHRLHRLLLDQAQITDRQRVLEIGCGTANLLLAAGARGAILFGIDPDPRMLARAEHKAARLGYDIQLDEAYADQLPLPDARLDRVLSSFMFHHLRAEDRPQALREAHRVLRPGGSLHLVDFGGSYDGIGWLGRRMRHHPMLQDNLDGRIPHLMTEAGFADARPVHRVVRWFGPVTFYSANVPAQARS